MRELRIEEIQEVSLEILKKVTDICDSLGLQYSLMYGTMIGAVRHQNFIPWDDDIDIMMPRRDYYKLMQYFEKATKKTDFLEIFDSKFQDDYPYMIARISDNRYIIDTENEKNCGLGVFIDIYPFDGVGSDWNITRKIVKKADKFASLCYRSTRIKPISHHKNNIINFFEVFLFFYAKLVGKKHFMKKLNSFVDLYPYSSSDYIACLTWASGGEKDIFKRVDFEKTEIMKFGKYEFKVASCYDKILTNIYGNYMKMPPEEERIGHHFYKVYEKKRVN